MSIPSWIRDIVYGPSLDPKPSPVTELRSPIRSTHTYALLAVSEDAYDEIKEYLIEAGYDHAFNGNEIDMHGIALVSNGKSLYAIHQEKKRGI